MPKEKQLVLTIFECHIPQQLLRFHFRYTSGEHLRRIFNIRSGSSIPVLPLLRQCLKNFKTSNETVHLMGAYNDLYFDFIKCGSSIALYVFGLSFSSASKSSSALVVGPFPYGLKYHTSHPKWTKMPAHQ